METSAASLVGNKEPILAIGDDGRKRQPIFADHPKQGLATMSLQVRVNRQMAPPLGAMRSNNRVEEGKAVPNPICRPMKYGGLIASLMPEELYTPATIARFARDSHFLCPSLSPEEIKNAMIRIRFSNNHQFPDEGDQWW